LAGQKDVIIKRAQELTARGDIKKAIAEWQKLIIETPQDSNIYNTIADLYVRLNNKPEAVEACLKAASLYREAGFDLKGIALLKKVLRIDPDRIDIHERLADIDSDRGLTGNAISAYNQVVKLYVRVGNFKAAIAVYQKLVRFSPGDPDIPLNIARLYQKQDQFREAVLSYAQAEAIYEEKNMVAEARHVVEEIVRIDPNYLSKIAKREADIAALEQAKERYVTGLPGSKSGSQPEEAPFARRVFMSEESPTPYSDSLSSSSDLYREISPPPSYEETGVGARMTPPKSEIPRPFQPIATSDVSDVIFQAHMAESETYIRCGLYQTAIERLLLAKELAPSREEPYLQLKEVYLKDGQKEKAAQIGWALASLYEQNRLFDKKEALLRELQRIDPRYQQPTPARESLPLQTQQEYLETPVWRASQDPDLRPISPPVVRSSFQESSTPVVEEEYFDLASAMTKELGCVEQGASGVLPKVEVSAPNGAVGLSQEDVKRQYSESCFDMGIAHKEMGNLEKAIREIEHALTGIEGNRFSEALLLLATCYVEQGNVLDAIGALEKGIADTRCQGTARLAVQYQLASFYEQIGQREKAIPLYQYVYGVEPRFKDVESKMREAILYQKAHSAFTQPVPSVVETPERLAVSSVAETGGTGNVVVVVDTNIKVAPLRDRKRVSYI
jgi:pentatricopeptide repeat protein